MNAVNKRDFITPERKSSSNLEGKSPGLGVTTGPIMFKNNFIDHSSIPRTPSLETQEKE